jgi:hypothetical protein
MATSKVSPPQISERNNPSPFSTADSSCKEVTCHTSPEPANVLLQLPHTGTLGSINRGGLVPTGQVEVPSVGVPSSHLPKMQDPTRDENLRRHGNALQGLETLTCFAWNDFVLSRALPRAWDHIINQGRDRKANATRRFPDVTVTLPLGRTLQSAI